MAGGHRDYAVTQGYVDRGKVEARRIGQPLPQVPAELLRNTDEAARTIAPNRPGDFPFRIFRSSLGNLATPTRIDPDRVTKQAKEALEALGEHVGDDDEKNVSDEEAKKAYAAMAPGQRAYADAKTPTARRQYIRAYALQERARAKGNELNRAQAFAKLLPEQRAMTSRLDENRARERMTTTEIILADRKGERTMKSDQGTRTTIATTPTAASWQSSGLGDQRPAPRSHWCGGPAAVPPAPPVPDGPSAEERVERERAEARRRAEAQGLLPPPPDPAGLISRSEAGRTWTGPPLAMAPNEPPPPDFLRDGSGGSAPPQWKEKRTGDFTPAPDIDHAAVVEVERESARHRGGARRQKRGRSIGKGQRAFRRRRGASPALRRRAIFDRRGVRHERRPAGLVTKLRPLHLGEGSSGRGGSARLTGGPWMARCVCCRSSEHVAAGCPNSSNGATAVDDVDHTRSGDKH